MKHQEEFTKTMDYFKAKRDAFLSRGTLDKLFLSAQRKTDTGLIVSNEIAETIGMSGLLHTIGEKVIAPAINKVVNPCDCIPHEQTIEVQDEVVNLQHDVSMRNKFSKLGRRAWFCHDIMEHYLILRSKLHMYMLPFPTTYLVEAGFSKLLLLWTKYRNRLNIERRGDLRMSMSIMTADMAKLASKHQFQGSH
ncbi:hypothetical protein GJ496_001827 [Pomphorhynchus laevis]|nr:hypothetical protein GJ496_001827 [Pomphorhynchus laevis]